MERTINHLLHICYISIVIYRVAIPFKQNETSLPLSFKQASSFLPHNKGLLANVSLP